ncbi:hypothetical protein CLCR_11048 [Cladophialophora carrionii]|uniref:Uncharacterized protein n=1 Tax=Cladophialophora carrionii TaxID=86049 RepID=A0A1C1CZ51_9EURO|nr:hypothetical protein CLCR_11048 [Cladophialophora carrionii]
MLALLELSGLSYIDYLNPPIDDPEKGGFMGMVQLAPSASSWPARACQGNRALTGRSFQSGVDHNIMQSNITADYEHVGVAVHPPTILSLLGSRRIHLDWGQVIMNNR